MALYRWWMRGPVASGSQERSGAERPTVLVPTGHCPGQPRPGTTATEIVIWETTQPITSLVLRHWGYSMQTFAKTTQFDQFNPPISTQNFFFQNWYSIVIHDPCVNTRIIFTIYKGNYLTNSYNIYKKESPHAFSFFKVPIANLPLITRVKCLNEIQKNFPQLVDNSLTANFSHEIRHILLNFHHLSI